MEAFLIFFNFLMVEEDFSFDLDQLEYNLFLENNMMIYEDSSPSLHQ